MNFWRSDGVLGRNVPTISAAGWQWAGKLTRCRGVTLTPRKSPSGIGTPFPANFRGAKSVRNPQSPNLRIGRS